MSDRYRNPPPVPDCAVGLLEGEVIEIPLLLPGWQASALETAAHRRGLTAAEMVRHVLRDFIVAQSRVERDTKIPPRALEPSSLLDK
jgi:hypothetical protein